MRPSSLYRSNSQRQPTIEASANNIHEDSMDCGITVLKCCNTPRCQALANKKSFMVVLIFCGLIQGAIETYFRTSAKQSALNHDYDPRIVDWLLVASGVFQGAFAILVAYWGNRIHRTAWLGGLFMLQSILCLIVVIPSLANENIDNTRGEIETSTVCIRNPSGHLRMDDSHGNIALTLLFCLQLGIALGIIAFYTLGFSYLDDNVDEHESPALLAGVLAAKFWGVQLGFFISLIVRWITLPSLGWISGWFILAPLLFIIGFIAVMFPKRLLSTLVKQATNRILESSTNSIHAALSDTKFIADVSFFSTIKRLFTNKTLIFNVLAAVFVQTAIINFTRHEANYLQSRFFLPTAEADGLNVEWTSQLVTSLLKPSMIALAILVAGLLIAKGNPAPRKLVWWNIIACSLVATFFIASIFIDCENSPLAGSHRGKIIKPLCAHSCFCSENVPFMPVCPENSVQTYFSPCYAGCSEEILINNVRVFGNCTCGADTELPRTDLIATEGACGMDDCQPFWISHQVLSVLASALLASTLIGKLIITLRSVLPQDKCTALAFELSIIATIVYIPGKMAYRFIANQTCQYVAPDKFRCFIHESPTYGDWINVVTAGLILIGIAFEIFLLFTVKDLLLYGDEPDDVYKPIEMETLRRQDHNSVPVQDEAADLNTALLQRYDQPQRMSDQVQYAQIIRPAPVQPQAQVIDEDRIDFRLQTPRQLGTAQNDDNFSMPSPLMSGGSSISSGYIEVTHDRNQVPRRVVRPTSPETSF